MEENKIKIQDVNLPLTKKIPAGLQSLADFYGSFAFGKISELKFWKYWLILPAVCLFLQAGVFTVAKFPSSASGKQAPKIAPQVLGVSTAVPPRGEVAAPAPIAVKSGEIDTSQISAESFLAYDLESGFVYASKNEEEKVSIASLTKLLTALVVYNTASFSDKVTIAPKHQLDVSPALKLKIADEVEVSDLFNSMLVGSTNDAAQALSAYVADLSGQDFVELMNRQAAELGMSSSNFSNPLGFDSKNNYSTAKDLQKLVNVTQKLAAFTNLGKLSSYKFQTVVGNTYFVKATNKLIGKYSDLEAVKTGFTAGSRGAMITKLTAGGHKIILVVLGSENREKDTLILRDQILRGYKFE